MTARRRIVILGAAGRDFHDFATCFADDASVEVVAFTAAQIPRIADRRFPGALAGSIYPEGIPIVGEDRLEELIAGAGVDDVVLSYSDLSHEAVMHLASRALAAGAGFRLLAPRATMLRSRGPVIAICAVRTGSGKSQVARYVVSCLRELGRRPALVRHPMPYGDLVAQRVQRFASLQDLDDVGDAITIEEREEYEPHVATGTVVYAGVDYREILHRAEAESDTIVWDGGNNDLPFFAPDLWITVVDPHRAGHELRYHPGEANLRAAQVVVVNKVDSAEARDVERVLANVGAVAPTATVVECDSRVTVDRPELVAGKRVVLVDDGPTLTHGEMGWGAGKVAAERFGAAEIVDPRPWAVGSIAQLYEDHRGLGKTVPAMGYYPEQLAELRETLARVDADVVLAATPIDLGRLIALDKPIVRVRYELADRGEPTLASLLREFVGRTSGASS